MKDAVLTSARRVTLLLALKSSFPRGRTKAMCECGQILWTGADEAQTRPLVMHAVSAARSQVAYSRALSGSRRARALIGDGAGGEGAWAAEQHARSRATSLRQFSEALAELRAAADPARVSQADTLIAGGAMRDLAASARHMAISRLLDSDISPDLAQAAVTTLNERLDTIASIGSFSQLTEFLSRHVDNLGAGPAGGPAQSGLCILILILSSVFAVLVLLAAIICLFTLGAGCSDILNQLIAQACPDAG